MVLPLSEAGGGVSPPKCSSVASASPGGHPASPPLDVGQDREQLTVVGRFLASWDGKREYCWDLIPLYCRVSTKASNSRTFFSCTASFSGSESCSGRGGKCSLFRETLEGVTSPITLRAGCCGLLSSRCLWVSGIEGAGKRAQDLRGMKSHI